MRQPPFVLLDDCRSSHRAGVSYLYHSPLRIITAETFSGIWKALEEIDRVVEQGLHVAGWISYEAAHALEHKLEAAINRKATEPLIWMLVTDQCLILEPGEMERLLHETEGGNSKQANLQFLPPKETPDSYQSALDTIQNYITAGDVYQINHTFTQPLKLQGDALTLYCQLRKTQPVSYGAFIDTGTYKVLSHSPELFIQKRGDTLTSRPMKGTAPRGVNPQSDADIQAALVSDSKSRAENLMIVDLIRNDISRISEPASVKVRSLFTPEKYETLHQLTSTVEAKAKGGLKPSELLSAVFPCGSVTGAPKIRAMEIIQSLEKEPRGIYCGAIGHFSHETMDTARHDNWCLNVPIRTIVMENDNTGRLSVGSGVVADSNSEDEYAECLLKAHFAKTTPQSFSLIETLRCENGTLQYLDLHLARLSNSCAYFDFPFDAEKVNSALCEHLDVLNKQKNPLHRIRLLLDAYGQVSVSSVPFVDHPADMPVTVCFAKTSMRSGDQFLYHKTTNRQQYDADFQQALKAGYSDLIYRNEHDQITEGAISSVFIEKAGQLYTPPLDAGLLPGILRQHLLFTRPSLHERPLSEDDLIHADKIYIGNALRGLREAKLVFGADNTPVSL